jgi:hypothetical protein
LYCCLQFEDLKASSDKRITFLLQQLAAATRQLVSARTAAHGGSPAPPPPLSASGTAAPVRQQPAASSGSKPTATPQPRLAQETVQHYANKFAEMPGQLRQLESSLKSATSPPVSRKQRRRLARSAGPDVPDVLLAGQQLASLYGKIAKQVDHLVHVLEGLPTETGDGVGIEGEGQGGQGSSNSSSNSIEGVGKKSNAGAGSRGARVGGVGGGVSAAHLEKVIRSMVTKQVGEKAGGGAAGSGADSSAGMPAQVAGATGAAAAPEVSVQPEAAAEPQTLLDHLRRLQQGESKPMAGLPAQVAAATGAADVHQVSMQPAAEPGSVKAPLMLALLECLRRSKQGESGSLA